MTPEELFFEGGLEDLKKAIAAADCAGAWRDIEHGHQFRARTGGAILNFFPSTGRIHFQGPNASATALRTRLVPHLGDGGTAGAATATADRPTPRATKRVFVVHGHDAEAREQLELVLHRLGLEPFVLANTGGGGRTIIEALEDEIGRGERAVRFGIVLMTPDDVGYLKADGPTNASPRARQNVVLEMGMLMAAIGRPRVAVLKKGHVEIPSDAQGILYIPFNDHVRETVPKLVDRLREAGFDLDPRAITRASS